MPDICPPPPPWQLRASLCVEVAISVCSPCVVVGAAKDILVVKAEVAPITPLLIMRAPRAEAVVHSAQRFGAVINVAMSDRDAVAKGATMPMARA